MPVNTWTQTIDNLFTSTWSYRKTQATEQAFAKTPFIYWLRQKGRVENVSGYTRIEVPLEYGSNTTVAWIGKGDTVNITDDELLTMAYEDWKTVAVNISRYRDEDQKNRGKARAIALVDTKLGAAERALWENFESVMFADGSGINEPNGLQNIVADNPTTGVLHGINRATYTWFRNQQKTATGPFSAWGLSDMRTCMNDITVYSSAEISDIIMITSQTVFEMYEDEMMEIKQIQNTMLADGGFTSLTFKGRPIIWCPSAPADKMYFINDNYLKLVCDEDYWMEMTDWKEIPNQPFDRVAQIVCSVNMVCTRPIVQKVLTNITA